MHREKGYVTDITMDKTINYIDKRDKSKPFFVMCHNKAPHRFWECDPKHKDLYKDEIKVPENFNDDYRNRAKAAAAAKMKISMDLCYVDLGLAQPEGGDEVGELLVAESAWQGGANDRKIPDPEDPSTLPPLVDRNTGEIFKFKTRDEFRKWKYQRYMQRYLRTIQYVPISRKAAKHTH